VFEQQSLQPKLSRRR